MNINNIKNITNNKHNNNEIKKISELGFVDTQITSHLKRSEEASPSLLARGSDPLRLELPEGCKFIKAEWFQQQATEDDTIRHKLSFAICKTNSRGQDRIVTVRALMNSPYRVFHRGLGNHRWDPHYALIRQRHVELKADNVWHRISKCYQHQQDRKGKTVIGMSVIWLGDGVCEFYWNDWHSRIEMTEDDLTVKQRMSDIRGTRLITNHLNHQLVSQQDLWEF